jgi:hypothetical protein
MVRVSTGSDKVIVFRGIAASPFTYRVLKREPNPFKYYLFTSTALFTKLIMVRILA